MFPLRRFLRALSRRARALSGQGGVLALWRYYSPFRPLGVVETGAPAQADTLVIFLPGIEDSAEDFHAQGFPQALRARFPGARCVALDAHLGYYLTRRIVRCLHEEIVRPARAAGVRRVVLVGVSMGALGALLYLRAHPREVQGLVLMAPFLGRDWRIRRFAARPDRPRALCRHGIPVKDDDPFLVVCIHAVGNDMNRLFCIGLRLLFRRGRQSFR